MNHEVFLFFNVSAISAVLKVETDISKFGKTGVTKIVENLQFWSHSVADYTKLY